MPGSTAPALRRHTPAPRVRTTPTAHCPAPPPQLRPPAACPYPGAPGQICAARSQCPPQAGRLPRCTAEGLPRRCCPAQSTAPCRSMYRSPPARRGQTFAAAASGLPQQRPAHTADTGCAAKAPPARGAAAPAPPLPHRAQSNPLPAQGSAPAQRASAPRTAPPSRRQSRCPPLPAAAPPGAASPVPLRAKAASTARPKIKHPSALS